MKADPLLDPGTGKTFRPPTHFLPERTSPELLYLETKWASPASYGVTSKLLHQVLSIDRKLSPVTIRNHTLQAARRSKQAMEAEQVMFLDGCQAECARGLPKSKSSIVSDTISDTIDEESLERRLESVKHYLWHGNTVMALDRLREVPSPDTTLATDTRAVGQVAAIAIGGTVGLEALFAGPVTGASMNPARSLGPTLASGS